MTQIEEIVEQMNAAGLTEQAAMVTILASAATDVAEALYAASPQGRLRLRVATVLGITTE